MNAPTGFRPASRSEAKPIIGLYSESGCGKTWSSLLLARGFVGPKGKIGMIETEGGRGEAYIGREPVGEYLVRPIRGNFSPMEYGQAISEAESANLDALIIDSASHEWEGAGGVLAMAAENICAAKLIGTKLVPLIEVCAEVKTNEEGMVRANLRMVIVPELDEVAAVTPR